MRDDDDSPLSGFHLSSLRSPLSRECEGREELSLSGDGAPLWECDPCRVRLASGQPEATPARSACCHVLYLVMTKTIM